MTPLQMARFYAMIANGGKLVTPYVVSGVEQPGTNRQQPVTLKQFPADPPRDAGVDPAALQAVRDGLWAAPTRRTAPRPGVFGSFPISISGKTGTAEKVVNLPGYPVGHLEDQSWWCGYGPSDAAQLVVCAVIENGGHGSSAAAPAALRVFEKYFNQKAPHDRGGERRLIAETRNRPSMLRSPSLGVFDVGLILRRLDWLLLLAVDHPRRLRALGDRRASRASTSPGTRTTS